MKQFQIQYENIQNQQCIKEDEQKEMKQFFLDMFVRFRVGDQETGD